MFHGKNGVGNNIRLRKYVQIMHLVNMFRNLLNFSISQLYVDEKTSLNKAEPGAHGRSHGVHGVYIVACQRCTSYILPYHKTPSNQHAVFIRAVPLLE